MVTHDIEHWKDEIAWMSLYFSLAVWASLALCVVYTLDGHLPQISHRSGGRELVAAGEASQSPGIRTP